MTRLRKTRRAMHSLSELMFSQYGDCVADLGLQSNLALAAKARLLSLGPSSQDLQSAGVRTNGFHTADATPTNCTGAGDGRLYKQQRLSTGTSGSATRPALSSREYPAENATFSFLQLMHSLMTEVFTKKPENTIDFMLQWLEQEKERRVDEKLSALQH